MPVIQGDAKMGGSMALRGPDWYDPKLYRRSRRSGEPRARSSFLKSVALFVALCAGVVVLLAGVGYVVR